MTLADLKPGQSARVLEIRGDDEDADRLMEMGLVEGTPLQVVRFAPLGDPIEIAARGYHLTLRKAEATNVVVEMARTPEN